MNNASVGGGVAASRRYRHGTLRAMSELMAPLFPTPGAGRRWPRVTLALTAVLMALGEPPTLAARFEAALDPLDRTVPARRRPGRTYQGFVKALARESSAIQATLRPWLRGRLRRTAGVRWTVGGFVPMAADGSRFDAPRTIANEAVLGVAGRHKTHPQMLTTSITHVPTGVAHDWRIGPACAGERAHLREMIDDLPENTLLLADAGFVGYDMLSTLERRGVAFLVRVGGNASLITGLDGRRPGVVHLWPGRVRRRHPPLPPLTLRLVRSGRLWLVTNVLDPRRLPRQMALSMYAGRWSVEVFYRTLKQTMGRRKMRSAAPANAQRELEWTLIAHLLLGLLTLGCVRGPWSAAGALGVVRRTLRVPIDHATLKARLRRCLPDPYRRRRSKKAWNWPHKKNDPPPRPPTIRKANESDIQQLQRLMNS